MIRIVADDKIPFLEGVLEPYAEVHYLPGSRITRAELLHADALLIRTRTRCDEELLAGTTVRFIATATIGFDHINTAYCSKAGIRWENAPGCNAGSVQQYMASALCTLAHYHGFSLGNKVLGIVGVGNVGRKIEKLAGALGMNVLLNDPPRERAEGKGLFVPLDRLLKESDFVSLHVPLYRAGQDKTYHMADEAFFEKMKKDAWFFNASRGEVMDSWALAGTLRENRIAGTVLDVWENEPAIDTDLLRMVSLATPHIAGYSADGKANGTAMAVNSCSSFFGLGLPHWYPNNIPLPEDPFIQLNAAGHSTEELLAKAILSTYSLESDNGRLRKSPALFESLRGNYPLRREFNAYTIKMAGENQVLADGLASLGFHLAKAGIDAR